MPSTYVYAVVPGDAPATPPAPNGVGGSPDLRLVVDRSLAAVVGTLPGELEATPENLTAHAGVVEHISATGTTLPVRFGVVLDDDDAVVERLLRRHERRLRELLDDLKGRVELRVRARYDNEAQLRHVLEQDRPLRELNERVKGLPPEKGQSQRMRLGEAVLVALERQQERDGDELLSELAPLAVRHQVLPAPADRVALNAAFLVDEAAQTRFEERVRVLENGAGGRITVSLLGPLPPWDFVDLDEGGD